MASLSAPAPLGDRYPSLWSNLYHYRPRALRARVVFATVAVCLFLFFITPRSSSQRPVYKSPSYLPPRPEDSTVLHPEPPSINGNDTLPSNLQKSNPSFHVLLPALHKSPALCRTVTSAMILNYPPPTLIHYGRDSPDVSSKYDAMRARITSIYNYLAHSGVEDDDFVLIIDGLDFWFQLPPEVMIRRFQRILEENNTKLRKKYGLVEVKQPSDKGIGKVEQKYTQRILFGASKQCFPNMTNDAGCASVPQSSLPPDAYGYKTDIHRKGHLNRPRWLNPSMVMGQTADLKLIYARMLQFIENNRRVSRGDYLALTQMYGQQEYVRELERRRTSNGFKEWLYRQIGISDASNITGVSVRLEPGQRYEYGIGVDYASQLFFNMFNSKRDVEWLPYNNISRTSSVQGEHGVPRERRLLLPSDLAHIPNPFVQPNFDSGNTITPPHNKTIDSLPNPRNHSWHNLPLLTNVHSAAVPALVHMEHTDGDRWLRDKWWSKMWYHKWARALLRKHTRTPSGFAASQAALFGGQEWWDLRGGRGGVWNDRGEWIDYPELCNGFERDIFDDNYGPWGKEVGASSEPLYNQYGRLIKGKGEPEMKPEGPPEEPGS